MMDKILLNTYEMKTIVNFVWMFLSIVAYGQTPYMIVGDSTIYFTTGNDIGYYNIFTEKQDTIIEADNNGQQIKTISISESFDITNSLRVIEWRITGSSYLIQRGQFNEDGKAIGIFHSYYPSDSATCLFLDGKKEGLQESFLFGGRTIVNYNDGKKEGISITMNKYSNIEIITSYKNGKREGWHELYYVLQNAYSLKSRSYYHNDRIIDGEHIVFHPNGNVFIRANYVNGVYEGLFTVYDKFGGILEQKCYSNGKLVGR